MITRIHFDGDGEHEDYGWIRDPAEPFDWKAYIVIDGERRTLGTGQDSRDVMYQTARAILNDEDSP